ncbi:hypothetical protein H696_02147 [Fonticula alba]|uniref:Uncharacterized protein n=1 Tax=Fonticula alba TaxID=691883 RepID=A0A058ZAA0_FONAL|nr:hypothetical protein H696_02147 [Fonticula alba]KCV71195.1 hypothetical protein H696_02147 [Fonticula alba]|eukprot:XP_009494318.1 hypothetical protein H696_02147 [Fonticula alba]
MLSNLLSSVLNRFLGQFLENVQPSQINLGLLRGNLCLENICLKSDALAALDIPITITSGFVGRLQIRIPWTDLANGTIDVHVNDVFVVVHPELWSDFDGELQAQRDQANKKRQVAAFEEAKKKALDSLSAAPPGQGAGFVAKLLARVVSSLRVTLTNVSIRVEDSVSAPDVFAPTVVLESLTIESTDGAWTVGGSAPVPAGMSFKSLALRNLAVIWEEQVARPWSKAVPSRPGPADLQLFRQTIPRRPARLLAASAAEQVAEQAGLRLGRAYLRNDASYLLYPIDFTATLRLDLATLPAKDSPKVTVDATLGPVCVAVNQAQVSQALGLASSFLQADRGRRYRRFRPSYGLPIRTNPRAYWKYAISAVLNDIHEKGRRSTWAFIRARRDLRVAYIEAYLQLQKSSILSRKSATARVDALESQLDAVDICFYRSLAERQLARERLSANVATSSVSWGEWLMGSKKDATLPQEQLRVLEQAIDYDPKLESKVFFEPDYVMVQARARLSSIGFRLQESIRLPVLPAAAAAAASAGTGGAAPTRVADPLLHLSVGDLAADVALRPGGASLDASVSVGALEVLDFVSASSVHQPEPEALVGPGDGQAITPSGEGAFACRPGQGFFLFDPVPHRLIDRISLSDTSAEGPLLTADVCLAPVDDSCDVRLKARLEGLLATVRGTELIARLLRVFLPVLDLATGDPELRALERRVTRRLVRLRDTTRSSLERHLAERQRVDLAVSLRAPMLLLPSPPSAAGPASCLLVDLGTVSVRSRLVPAAAAAAAATGGAPSGVDLLALSFQMYDRFDLALDGLEILVGEDFESLVGRLASSPASPQTPAATAAAALVPAPAGARPLGAQAVSEAAWSQTPCHLLSPFSFSIVLAKCIAPNLRDFSNMKLSGSALGEPVLPLLAASLSEVDVGLKMGFDSMAVHAKMRSLACFHFVAGGTGVDAAAPAPGHVRLGQPIIFFTTAAEENAIFSAIFIRESVLASVIIPQGETPMSLDADSGAGPESFDSRLHILLGSLFIKIDPLDLLVLADRCLGFLSLLKLLPEAPVPGPASDEGAALPAGSPPVSAAAPTTAKGAPAPGQAATLAPAPAAAPAAAAAGGAPTFRLGAQFDGIFINVAGHQGQTLLECGLTRTVASLAMEPDNSMHLTLSLGGLSAREAERELLATSALYSLELSFDQTPNPINPEDLQRQVLLRLNALHVTLFPEFAHRAVSFLVVLLPRVEGLVAQLQAALPGGDQGDGVSASSGAAAPKDEGTPLSAANAAANDFLATPFLFDVRLIAPRINLLSSVGGILGDSSQVARDLTDESVCISLGEIRASNQVNKALASSREIAPGSATPAATEVIRASLTGVGIETHCRRRELAAVVRATADGEAPVPAMPSSMLTGFDIDTSISRQLQVLQAAPAAGEVSAAGRAATTATTPPGLLITADLAKHVALSVSDAQVGMLLAMVDRFLFAVQKLSALQGPAAAGPDAPPAEGAATDSDSEAPLSEDDQASIRSAGSEDLEDSAMAGGAQPTKLELQLRAPLGLSLSIVADKRGPSSTDDGAMVECGALRLKDLAAQVALFESGNLAVEAHLSSLLFVSGEDELFAVSRISTSLSQKSAGMDTLCSVDIHEPTFRLVPEPLLRCADTLLVPVQDHQFLQSIRAQSQLLDQAAAEGALSRSSSSSAIVPAAGGSEPAADPAEAAPGAGVASSSEDPPAVPLFTLELHISDTRLFVPLLSEQSGKVAAAAAAAASAPALLCLALPRTSMSLATSGSDMRLDLVVTSLSLSGERISRDLSSLPLLAPMSCRVGLTLKETSIGVGLTLQPTNISINLAGLIILSNYGGYIASTLTGCQFLNADARRPKPDTIVDAHDILRPTEIDRHLVLADAARQQELLSHTAAESQAVAAAAAADAPGLAAVDPAARALVVSLHLQGLHLTVVNDLGLTNTPLFDVCFLPLSVDLTGSLGEVTSMAVSISPSFYVNYFNNRRSAWEPVIEKWSCSASVSIGQATSIELLAPRRLECTVTHDLLQDLLRAGTLFQELSGQVSADNTLLVAARSAGARSSAFEVINSTGLDLHLALVDMAEGAPAAVSATPSLLALPGDGSRLSSAAFGVRPAAMGATAAAAAAATSAVAASRLSVSLAAGADGLPASSFSMATVGSRLLALRQAVGDSSGSVAASPVAESPSTPTRGSTRAAPLAGLTHLASTVVAGVGGLAGGTAGSGSGATFRRVPMVVDINVVDGLKVVHFRSPLVLENATSVPLEVVFLPAGAKADAGSAGGPPAGHVVQPHGGTLALPVTCFPHGALAVRPVPHSVSLGSGSAISDVFDFCQALDLSGVPGQLLRAPSWSGGVLECNPVNGSRSVFHLAACFASSGAGRRVNLRLFAPLVLENVLPTPVAFGLETERRAFDSVNGFSRTLDPCSRCEVFDVPVTGRVYMGLSLPQLGSHRRSPAATFCSREALRILDPSMGAGAGEGTIDLFTDNCPDPLGLRVAHRRLVSGPGSHPLPRALTIFSPYLIVNKTGLDLQVRNANRMSASTIGVGDATPLEDTALTMLSTFNSVDGSQSCPMTLYVTSSMKSLTSLRVHESQWSSPFNTAAVGSEGEVTLLGAGKSTKAWQLASEIRLAGAGAESTLDQQVAASLRSVKVITLKPRYILVNHTNVSLDFRHFEAGTGKSTFLRKSTTAPSAGRSTQDEGITTILPGKSSAFHFQQGQDLNLSLRQSIELMDGFRRWSAGFSANNVGESFVRIFSPQGQVSVVRVDVSLEGAVLFVRVFPFRSEAPFRLVNLSSYHMALVQGECASATGVAAEPDTGYRMESYLTDSNPVAGHYFAAASQVVPFLWDTPLSEKRLVKLYAGDAVNALRSTMYSPECAIPPASLPLDLRVIGRRKPVPITVTSRESGAQTRRYVLVTVDIKSTATVVTIRDHDVRPARAKIMAPIAALRPRGVLIKRLHGWAAGTTPEATSPTTPDAGDLARTGSSDSLAQPPSAGGADGSDEDTELASLSSAFSFNLAVNLKGIGLSIVNAVPREIMYLTVQDLKLQFSDSSLSQAIDLTVGQMQIDDTSRGSLFPVVFHSTITKQRAGDSGSSAGSVAEAEPGAVITAGDASSAKPLLYLSTLIVKQPEAHVFVAKSLSVLLQECELNCSEVFLMRMLDFVFSVLPSSGSSSARLQVGAPVPGPRPGGGPQPEEGHFAVLPTGAAIRPPALEEPGLATLHGAFGPVDPRLPRPQTVHRSASTRLYFGVFEIQPIQINLTLMRSRNPDGLAEGAAEGGAGGSAAGGGEGGPDGGIGSTGAGAGDAIVPAADDAPQRSVMQGALVFGFLSSVVDLLSMSLGSIDRAPIRLNSLEVSNFAAADSLFVSLVTRHYATQVMRQLLMLVGSIDMLGNPVGLFNSLSSGVQDFFYEPAQGLTRGSKEFLLGAAAGTSSLLRSTGSGVLDSATKITSSLSKGVAEVTFDSRFQQDREVTRIAARSQGTVKSTRTGLTTFARGLGSALTGVVTKPLDGAKEEGLKGFLSGVGKGVAGAVTKPVVGLLDGAAIIASGIRNDVSGSVVVAEHVRIPRYIGPDRILRPYYPHHSFGNHLLTTIDEGQFFTWDYINHLDIRRESASLYFARQGILYVDARGPSVKWFVTFDRLVDWVLVAPPKQGAGAAVAAASAPASPAPMLGSPARRDAGSFLHQSGLMIYYVPTSLANVVSSVATGKRSAAVTPSASSVHIHAESAAPAAASTSASDGGLFRRSSRSSTTSRSAIPPPASSLSGVPDASPAAATSPLSAYPSGTKERFVPLSDSEPAEVEKYMRLSQRLFEESFGGPSLA